MNNVRENVLKALDNLGIDTTDITTMEDVNLMDYVVDSITFISFIVELENMLGFDISDEFLDFEKLNSFNGFVAMIEAIN